MILQFCLPQDIEIACLGELTAAVLGDPVDTGSQAVDVKVLAVKLRALLFAEVFPSSWTWLSVAGAKFHAAAHAEATAISRPKVTEPVIIKVLCISRNTLLLIP